MAFLQSSFALAPDAMNDSTRSGSPETNSDTQKSPPRIQQASPSHRADRGSETNPEKSHKAMARSEISDGSEQPATTTSTVRKKKGTASVVKAPKRGKGGPKKPKPASKKSKKSEGSHDQDGKGDGEADGNPGLTADEDAGGSSESDSGPYCICRGPDNHRFMIACDQCEDWFHGDCIGMDKYTGENLVQRYICPNCTDGKMYVTRYKKMCSLEGCEKPARIYDSKMSSVFCGDEHCQAWWEQLIATLPKDGLGNHDDVLTQKQFMALVSGSAGKAGDQNTPWKLANDPFGVTPDFWENIDPKLVLSEEEMALLSTSAQRRHNLGEEIVLCKKMLQLVEMAARRRDAAIAASASLGKGHALGKDFCGYDSRLDTVGATAAFARFAKSPAGEAIFRAGKLDAPAAASTAAATSGSENGTTTNTDTDTDAMDVDAPAAAAPEPDPLAHLTAGMCPKKKCRPHAQWIGIFTRAPKHQIRELARQAKECLDAEARVRDAAAVRYRRRPHENNRVIVFDDDDEDVV